MSFNKPDIACIEVVFRTNQGTTQTLYCENTVGGFASVMRYIKKIWGAVEYIYHDITCVPKSGFDKHTIIQLKNVA